VDLPLLQQLSAALEERAQDRQRKRKGRVDFAACRIAKSLITCRQRAQNFGVAEPIRCMT
jgi:hypothetical protein